MRKLYEATSGQPQRWEALDNWVWSRPMRPASPTRLKGIGSSFPCSENDLRKLVSPCLPMCLCIAVVATGFSSPRRSARPPCRQCRPCHASGSRLLSIFWSSASGTWLSRRRLMGSCDRLVAWERA